MLLLLWHAGLKEKMVSVETIPAIGGGKGWWKRMVKGVNSSMIYFIHCKNFYKCHNIPHPAQQ
jgi:hypothetical protein